MPAATADTAEPVATQNGHMTPNKANKHSKTKLSAKNSLKSDEQSMANGTSDEANGSSASASNGTNCDLSPVSSDSGRESTASTPETTTPHETRSTSPHGWSSFIV